MHPEISYKEEVRKYNRALNYYVDIFKKKYSTSININVFFNEKMIELNMMGIGADEFYSLRRIKQPVGSHYVEIDNKILLKFTDEVEYYFFEMMLIKKLLLSGKAKKTCKLKRKL